MDEAKVKSYLDMISPGVIHFNTDHLAEAYEDKTITDLSKTRHILKLFNCSYVNINDRNISTCGRYLPTMATTIFP